MEDPDNLALLPYRRPYDLPVIQRKRIELANCYWCQWRADEHVYRSEKNKRYAPAPGWCTHPSQFCDNKTKDYELCGACCDWNKDGTCEVYQPTFWIRVLTTLRILKKPFRYIEIEDNESL